jgi:hypothetical protein
VDEGPSLSREQWLTTRKSRQQTETENGTRDDEMQVASHNLSVELGLLAGDAEAAPVAAAAACVVAAG